MHDLEAGGGVAQQPMRARDVAGRQHEAVGAAGQRLEQVAQDVAQAREAFERPQLEHLVEQERARFAAGRARRIEEGEQRIERLARGRRRRSAPCHGNGDDGGDGLEEPLGRGGAALDVDVLRGAAARRARAGAAAARCGRCRSRRG